ncbi:S-adenosyl-L-methionine-dependent methyltransferases superfamily protein [Actinidia rufa]|uniref:S-adenosyl-L-methionine-dependent methyltransferases superfamily protein n=1 Tax=Actinidia rufa TaxID=165716 RepID=A0A7J0GK88_9ERIC|nr:S-adenosyl-L-methionine-dependent methyltransferases superfamily protein [Actinidia rufa]
MRGDRSAMIRQPSKEVVVVDSDVMDEVCHMEVMSQNRRLWWRWSQSRSSQSEDIGDINYRLSGDHKRHGRRDLPRLWRYGYLVNNVATWLPQPPPSNLLSLLASPHSTSPTPLTPPPPLATTCTPRSSESLFSTHRADPPPPPTPPKSPPCSSPSTSKPTGHSPPRRATSNSSLICPEISRLILIGNLPIDPRPTIYNKPPPIDEINRSIIKESLRPLLFALCPKSVFNNGLPEIQFLGYEDDVIRSVTVGRFVGSCVGEMLVEDVELEGMGEFGGECEREFRRRLRFRRMPNLVQTQMRIVPKRGSHVNGDLGSMSLGDFEFELDTVSLVQPYFAPMVAILSLVGSCLEETIRGGFRPKALCLGVGGGALLTFLNEQLGFEVVGVEADEVALSVARKYFGLQDDNGCWLGNADRLDDKFDVIMVDLDSSDVGMGTMAPPLEFVEKSVLRDARLVLSEHGILVINMIPPNRSFYELLVHEFREFFSELYEIDVGNGENFVLVATAISNSGGFE